MKVILLGYMASGKSTIGKQLANEMALPFIDLDAYIEKKENKTITKIFEENGEIYFRLQEHKHLKELLAVDKSFVLSLGGGTPCYANNMNEILMTKNTISVYLKASINTLVQRLQNEKEARPLLAKFNEEKLTEFVAKHLFERADFYNKATHQLVIDSLSVSEAVAKIFTLLK